MDELKCDAATESQGIAVATKRGKPKRGAKPIEPAGLEIVIPALEIDTIELKVTGDSPLVSHAWSEKSKRAMADKQAKAAKNAKEARNPRADFIESMYWLTEKPSPPESATEDDVAAAKFGFPVLAFKSAAVDACSHVSNMTKVVARGAFHIIGEYVEIISGPPRMRTDMVRIAMGTADIRYRGEFTEWSTVIKVRYNKTVITPEQIVHLFNVAGFAIGVGEGRPQKDRSWGMFHVALS